MKSLIWGGGDIGRLVELVVNQGLPEVLKGLRVLLLSKLLIRAILTFYEVIQGYSE